ncbi:sulfite exporter TauE/SafE family protein [Thermococcus sp. SY098]|uniref:sulfite exporter TauE/SafE family protein n=1 Tax=Thermococcus sp. SY098 TaxID=3111325 RepID=UPI002D765B5D|nr:sulfite exporter TauE/SafE family protein [Thermococcus sp. SY098]WRS52915.1 sulfite exporter TauE/SafE family protein [Thermococcus sp. SY098]
MLWHISIIFIGFFIGLFAGLFGIGGGFLIVPVLTLLGLPIHEAIGTSLACISMSALASAYGHLRRKNVLFKVVVIKEAFSIPSALLGAYITAFLNTRQLSAIFGFALIYVAYKLIKKPETPSIKRNVKVDYRKVPVIGIISGFSSGLLGISGGILNVPLFYSLGLPIHYAIGTSSVALFFTALAGTVGHYILGQVHFDKAILLAPGLILGGFSGARLAHEIHPERLKMGFSLVLLIIATRMILKGLGFSVP